MQTSLRASATADREPPPPLLALLHEGEDACPTLCSEARSIGFRVLRARFEQARLRLRGQRWLQVEAVFIAIRTNPQAGLRILSRIRRRDWALPVVVIDPRNDRRLKPEAERLGATAVVRHELDAVRLAQDALGPAASAGAGSRSIA